MPKCAVYPKSSAALKIFCLVAALIFGLPLKAYETVETETFAARAISRIFAIENSFLLGLTIFGQHISYFNTIIIQNSRKVNCYFPESANVGFCALRRTICCFRVLFFIFSLPYSPCIDQYNQHFMFTEQKTIFMCFYTHIIKVNS